MLTTERAVVIVDGRQLITQCDWYNITQSDTSVWIEPLRL